MAKRPDSHSEMAHARQNDGINVIFDQRSPVSTRSRSRSRSRSGSSCESRRSCGSGHYRGRGVHRARYRSSSSSSSSSSSRSTSRRRSRSHPRCHRPSSRCRCDNHRRYGRGRKSPPRRYRARSRSYSRTPSPDRSSRSKHYKSRSRSSSRWSRYRRSVRRFSRSPSRTYRSNSRSKPSGHSANFSLDEKREFLKAAIANAATIQGVEKVELPESVKPVLSEQPEESKQVLAETWVRQEDPEKTPSQSSEVEPDDMSSPRMSPKRKIISFSINNSVVKPTVAAPSGAKVTSRVDSYESRRPYGHWVPVKSGQSSNARKHTRATSH
ncbi:arginine/serine-rich protein 1 [Plectropomus leopardus]|uniref:arginine/serine-rich protein 1 n=1 Tax=Plectropomus leopardus TaxID=160734 RepID=UPI001C4BF253|nr:arginine/serine-rich protein 1 [Plectropomus leopardus]